MKVNIMNSPSDRVLKDVCKYLFELIEKKNIYDKIKEASNK